MVSQRRCFDLLLAAMPEKILDQLMDVVDNVPEGLYTYIRHSEGSPGGTITSCLTRRRWTDILFKSEPLGGRNTFHMLAIMLAYYCPSGMEYSATLQICSSSVCWSSCGLCWGEQEPMMTSEAWRPGRINFGPPTDSSPIIWWLIWK